MLTPYYIMAIAFKRAGLTFIRRKDVPDRSAYLYRHKPIVVEAFQMTEARRNDNIDWPEWLHRAWNMDIEETGSVGINPNDANRYFLVVNTDDGLQAVHWGDYIVKDADGMLSVWLADEFEKSFESHVEQPTLPVTPQEK